MPFLLLLVLMGNVHGWAVPGFPVITGPTTQIGLNTVVTLTCTVIEGDPVPDVWFSVGNQNVTSGINSNYNTVTKTKTVLFTFTTTKQDHLKVYDCNVDNGVLQDPLRTSFSTNVSYPPDPLTFTAPSVVFSGTSATWTCVSSGGYPQQSVTITSNGNLATTETVVKTTDGYRVTGTLNWAPTAADHGSSVCCVVNHQSLTTPQTECRPLQIQSITSSQVFEGPTFVTPGLQRTWSCQSFGGFPKPTVAMSLNGIPLSTTETVTMAADGTYTVMRNLTWIPTTADDGKTLCCDVTNPTTLQTATQCKTIQVQVIPSPPILSGPTLVTSGATNTWTCVSAGGFPEQDVQMTMNGDTMVTGFVETTTTAADGTKTVQCTLTWAAALVNNGQDLCCIVTHEALIAPQSVCKTLQVQTSTPDQCGGPGDVAFVLDGSDSISDNNYELMKQFILHNIDAFSISDAQIRVGGLVYSSTVTESFSPSGNKPYVKNTIANFGRDKQGTRTDLGIKVLRENILTSSRTKVGVVITDGESLEPTLTEQEANTAKAAGITLVAVGIDMEASGQAELYKIASSPELVRLIPGFSSLQNLTEIQALRDKLCDVITTTPSPSTTLAPTTSPLVVEPIVTNAKCEGCQIDNGHGYNKHSGDCSKFYHCYITHAADGTEIMMAQEEQCAFGTFWSQYLLTCVKWEDTTCPDVANVCSGETDTTRFVYLGCQSYWICQNQIPVAAKCPAGQIFDGPTLQCVASPSHACLTVVVAPCNFEVDNTDQTKFLVKIPQQDGSILRQSQSCAPGTLFDISQCNCVLPDPSFIAVPSDCLPIIEQGTNGQFTYEQTRPLMYGLSPGLDVTSDPNAIRFADSFINMWRMAHYDFKDKFAVTLNINPDAFTGTVPSVEQIMTNCIYINVPTTLMDKESISLQVVKQTSSFVFVGSIETTNGPAVTTVTVSPPSTGFIPVVFAYDGNKLALKVGGTENSQDLTGNILLTQSGLVFGRSMIPNLGNLFGSISNIKIYDCISQTVMDALIAI